MNRAFVLLLLSGCGVEGLTLRSGESVGYSFSRGAVTAPEDGDVRLEIKGCRGWFAAQVRSNDGVQVSRIDVEPSLGDEAHSIVIADTGFKPMAVSAPVVVTRGGQTIGRIRAIEAHTERDRFMVQFVAE